MLVKTGATVTIFILVIESKIPIFRSLRLPNKREFYAFLIGCLITVFHFSVATFLASDI